MIHRELILDVYIYVPSLKLHMGFGNNCMSIRQKKLQVKFMPVVGAIISQYQTQTLLIPSWVERENLEQ